MTSQFLGEYRAAPIPVTWLSDGDLRKIVEANLHAEARRHQNGANDQTRTITYAHHTDPALCTPIIQWVNHE